MRTVANKHMQYLSSRVEILTGFAQWSHQCSIFADVVEVALDVVVEVDDAIVVAVVVVVVVSSAVLVDDESLGTDDVDESVELVGVAVVESSVDD